MGELRAAASIYRRLIGAQIRSQMQYRASLALDAAGVAGAQLLELAAVAIFFRHVPSLEGWSLAEVALLYGLAGAAFALSDIVLGHLDEFPSFIREGRFDGLLIRPVGTLLQLAGADFALRRLGKLTQALVVLAVAAISLDVAWTPVKVLLLPLAIVSGAVLFCCIWTLGASVVFWTTDAMEATNAFTYGGNYISAYPLSMFGPWMRRLFGFAFGLAFVAYLPALAILDKPDPLGLPSALRYATPLAAVAAALVAGTVWRIAVRHYRSTGS